MFFRVKSGNPGILVVVNAIEEKVVASIPKEIPVLADLEEVTVQMYSKNYNETIFMGKGYDLVIITEYIVLCNFFLAKRKMLLKYQFHQSLQLSFLLFHQRIIKQMSTFKMTIKGIYILEMHSCGLYSL